MYNLIINSSSAWTLMVFNNIILYYYDLGTFYYKCWAFFLTFTSILFHGCKGDENVNINIRYIFGHLDALAIVGISSYYLYCIQYISILSCLIYIYLIKIQCIDEKYYKFIIFIIGMILFLKDTYYILIKNNNYLIYLVLFNMFNGNLIFILNKGQLHNHKYSLLYKYIWHLGCACYIIQSGYNINEYYHTSIEPIHYDLDY